MIITTKKGKAGKPAWSLSQKVGQFTDARRSTSGNSRRWRVRRLGITTTLRVRPRPPRSRPTTHSSPVSTRARRITRASCSATARPSYETDLSVSGTQGDPVLRVRPLEVRQRDPAQHRVQQAVDPVERHRSSSPAPLRRRANLFYAHCRRAVASRATTTTAAARTTCSRTRRSS